MARRNRSDHTPGSAKVPPGSRRNSPEQDGPVDVVGKRVQFDRATWQTLDLLARDRMMTFQELADEAFLDVLRKHNRPYDTRDALRRSARLAQANENQPGKRPPKSKRPARGRARS
jgi:hypothetical protein